jgi:hypothetical protein
VNIQKELALILYNLDFPDEKINDFNDLPGPASKDDYLSDALNIIVSLGNRRLHITSIEPDNQPGQTKTGRSGT